jgi:hypothetical protein
MINAKQSHFAPDYKQDKPEGLKIMVAVFLLFHAFLEGAKGIKFRVRVK